MGFQTYPDYVGHLIDRMIDQIDKDITKQTIDTHTVWNLWNLRNLCVDPVDAFGFGIQ